MQNPEFLKQKHPDLSGSKPVEQAVSKARREGEKIPDKTKERIQAYLDRLEKLALDPKKEQKRKTFRGDEKRPRALFILREMLMNKYVRSHKEKMAESAARVEERAARQLGIEAQYGLEELEQRGQIAVEDLEKSLDNWIEYLSNANEPYPTWFRYYVFRNVLDLGDYDKDKKEFSKRSPGSFRLFPDIDRGALAYVEQMIEAAKDPVMLERLRQAQLTTDAPADQLLTKEKSEKFSQLSFAKQYVEAIKQAGDITPEMREEIQGKWVKYQKGTDPTALWASLQNKGTAWCTKGFATAETQLKGGDFYVYYTQDRQGKPNIPRIAIRMQGDGIGEVRGVADTDQNLEGSMAAIAEEKMRELPGAERYQKNSADMKQLTAIEKKIKKDEGLIKSDLLFLYEMNSKIEGFGYQRDPRIEELRKQRNLEEDMLTIFECSKDQIANNSKEINQNTKAYVGKLEPGIFTKLQEYKIEHIYTSFPEGRIRKETIEIGGKSKTELEKEMEIAKIYISDYAKFLLESKDFATFKKSESATLFRLTVKGLGFPNGATTNEIYQRAKELGLELCPPEVGPHYRLQYQNQPMNEWLFIGMKQIAGSDGGPSVFRLARGEGGLWLDDIWASLEGGWNPGSGFVFRHRTRA